MKSLIKPLILAALCLPSVVASRALEAVEETAPYTYSVGSTVSADIKLADVYGKEHSFGDYRGKIVFIHFWSIDCPVVTNYEPKFVELQKELGGKGVVQIAINANPRELRGDYGNLRAYVSKAGLNFLVTVDPGNKISDLFGVEVAPHCFVIDERGVVRYTGAFDDDFQGDKGNSATPYVRDAILALFAGNPVPVSRTRPYGCAIKPPD